MKNKPPPELIPFIYSLDLFSNNDQKIMQSYDHIVSEELKVIFSISNNGLIDIFEYKKNIEDETSPLINRIAIFSIFDLISKSDCEKIIWNIDYFN